MTDDEIEAMAKKHICPHHDRLDAILPNRVPYQQTEQFRRVKALVDDVLSKLRAPVADDLPRKTHEFELRAMSTNYTQGHCWDHLDAKCTAGAADEIRALRAALASAPVAGEAVSSIGVFVKDGKASHPASYGPRLADGFHILYAAPQASEAVRDQALEACRLIVERFGPTEHDYIFSKRMAIQKCRAALSAQPGAQRTGGSDA